MKLIRGIFTSEHLWTGIVIIACFVLALMSRDVLEFAIGAGIAVGLYSISRGLSKFNLGMKK